MSTKTLKGLQNALESSAGKKPPVVAPPVPTIPLGRAPSRSGLVNISAWLPKEVRKHIRMVQVRKPDTEDSTLQGLMLEAFNELFIKYDVPTIAHEEK